MAEKVPYHEKPYWDDDGNWVIPINRKDSDHILGKVDMFRRHAHTAVGNQLDIARKARNLNAHHGGNRGNSTKRG